MPDQRGCNGNLSASLLNHLMNMDQASGPRMPRIKKLVLRDPVGVPSSLHKDAPIFVQFNRSESFAHTRSWAGFTIITFGFEFSVHTTVPDRCPAGVLSAPGRSRRNGRSFAIHPEEGALSPFGAPLRIGTTVYLCFVPHGPAQPRKA